MNNFVVIHGSSFRRPLLGQLHPQGGVGLCIFYACDISENDSLIFDLSRDSKFSGTNNKTADLGKSQFVVHHSLSQKLGVSEEI